MQFTRIGGMVSRPHMSNGVATEAGISQELHLSLSAACELVQSFVDRGLLMRPIQGHLPLLLTDKGREVFDALDTASRLSPT